MENSNRPEGTVPASAFNTEGEADTVHSEKFPNHLHPEYYETIDEILDRDLEKIYAAKIQDANRKDLSTWKGILKRRKIALGIVISIQVLLLIYIVVDYTTSWQF